jgi:hypothetical protein
VKLFKIPDSGSGSGSDSPDRDYEKERAAKALKLNRFDSIAPSLYLISPPTGDKIKPTIRIKRLKPTPPIKSLKGESAIQDKLKREKERAEKALKLNGLFS